MTKAAQICELRRICYYVLKLLGLASYEVDWDTLKIKTGLRDFFLFITTISILIGVIWMQTLAFTKKTFSTGIQSKLLETLYLDQYIIQIILAAFVVIFNFCKRKRVEKFVQKIASYDEMAGTFKKKKSQGRSKTVLIILVMISPLIFIPTNWFMILYVFNDTTNPLSFLELMRMTTYTYVTEFYLMLSMQFILSTRCVISRLSSLSEISR